MKSGAVECESDEADEILQSIDFDEDGYIPVGIWVVPRTWSCRVFWSFCNESGLDRPDPPPSPRPGGQPLEPLPAGRHTFGSDGRQMCLARSIYTNDEHIPLEVATTLASVEEHRLLWRPCLPLLCDVSSRFRTITHPPKRNVPGEEQLLGGPHLLRFVGIDSLHS